MINTIKKPTIIIIGSLLGVLLMAVTTVVVLRLTGTTPQAREEQVAEAVTLAEVPSVDSIFSGLEEYESGTLSSLYTKRDAQSTDTTAPQPSDEIRTTAPQQASNNNIFYKFTDGYTAQVATSDHVQYVRSDASVESNDTSLVGELENYLIELKFAKLPKQQLGVVLSYTIFDSVNVVCQVNNEQSSVGSAASFGLACVLKSVVNEQKELIDTLLALSPNSTPDTSDVVRASEPVSEDGKRFVMVTVSGEAATTYYFASLSDEWEYIGERTIVSAEDPAGFLITEELASKINDPKWGDFLKKYIRS